MITTRAPDGANNIYQTTYKIYPEMFLMHLIISSFQSRKALLTQLKLKLVSLRDRCNARGLFTSVL